MEGEGDESPGPGQRDVDSLPRGGFRCCLCHVTVANKPSLDDHLRGKKHQRLESLRTLRHSQELRSVFVSGFGKGTTASELSDYFQAYGEVANVVMDKDKGVYAIVELQNEDVLQKVLSQPQHTLGSQKLRVKPREKKNFKYNPPRKQGSAMREQLSPEKLAQNLCQADDVDGQTSLLVQLFEFSESERRLRDLLVTLFQEVFSEFFPESAILPFGSSVNGFSVSGCDLDLFLDLEKTQTFQASAKVADKSQAEEEANLETDSQSEDSILTDIDLVTATVPEILELVATVLQKCVPGVHNVQVVSTARRPVVKFCHKESGLRGDISINNRLALCNTRFLQFCTEADERVRPLVYAVRYWAKQQSLAGNPFGGGPLLNNYALTLLVLFFLQTRSPPVLPTMAHLREMSDDGNLTLVDGWDCSFPRDTTSLEPSRNTDNRCFLLAEFFRVFENCSFVGRVISLREGRFLPLPAFLLSEAGSRFKVGPINLQDPFELSHNVAANVNEKTALRFQRCCHDAAKYCRSLQYQRKSSKGKIWGLVRLFQPGSWPVAERLLISLPLTQAAVCNQSHEHLAQSGDPQQLVCFRRVCAGVTFVLEHMLKCSCFERPKESVEGLGSPGGEQEEEALERRTGRLSVGSKRSLDVEDNSASSPPAKKPRAESFLPVGESLSWDCTVWHRVWLGRRRVRRQFSSPGPNQALEPLELEAKVSEAISQQEGETRPVDPLLQFTICATVEGHGSGEGDPRVSLSFSPFPEQGGLFQDFFHFLQGFLPRIVEQYLSTRP